MSDQYQTDCDATFYIEGLQWLNREDATAERVEAAGRALLAVAKHMRESDGAV